ncbi:MAG: hypothetical protein M0Z75_13715 [Nitrospiraceae bacterium]|nr:hypothetical protein [Nitrospiraceae bacterium]
MEKLKKNDFVFAFWLGHGGLTAWLLERQGELFLQMLSPNRGWSVEHFPALGSGGREQVEAVIRTMRIMNWVILDTLNQRYTLADFNETPVFCEYSHMSAEHREKLENQFRIFDEAMAKQREIDESKSQPVTGSAPGGDEEDSQASKPKAKLELVDR